MLVLDHWGQVACMLDESLPSRCLRSARCLESESDNLSIEVLWNIIPIMNVETDALGVVRSSWAHWPVPAEDFATHRKQLGITGPGSGHLIAVFRWRY